MALRDVAIVGVHATRQARVIEDQTGFQLTWEAVNGALADAGLGLADVDGAALGFSGPGGALNDAGSWARLFSRPLRFINDTFDTAGARAVLKAAAAVSVGLCDVAVVGGAAATSSPFVPGGGLDAGGRTVERPFSSGPVGVSGDPFGSYASSNFGMVQQRHMFEFGTTVEQVAEVSATLRNAGHVNPEAVMHGRGPYTVEDILASRPVALPVRLLDISIVAQGGAAVVLTTTERARDLRQPVVAILGGEMEFARGAWTGSSVYRECGMLGADGARRMYGTAGVQPEDTDVFCLYDPISFEVIRQFEMLGLCAPGEGGELVTGGTIARDGRFPVNPDGGCLAYSWLGLQQLTLKIIEAVRQVRGTAVNQVDGCEVALATCAGSSAKHIEMALLGRL